MFFRIAVILMLILLSVSDLKSHTISVLPVLAFAVVMAAVHLTVRYIPPSIPFVESISADSLSGEDLPVVRIFTGMLPGLFLLAVSLASRSSIGTGDGIAVAACGAAIGLSSELASLTVALVLCCAYSIVLLIRKKAGRKDTLPFLPFLTAGHILVLITEARI